MCARDGATKPWNFEWIANFAMIYIVSIAKIMDNYHKELVINYYLYTC